ncbi:hypothetical protein GV67_04225 [Pseudorhizobium pelagicum]|uniref:Uncharacterized protein n=1 Tax=Pseudorhizobium pelagicum TaxID=1509405 RepID=A0A922TAN5_9HYPH|nr:hypothetical protein GV67_04225 [Pseudorhizobium pelagicum]KEQ06439.1 hypothetical protein GV68_07220 [Pseudorhizobium pelagicum]
MIASAGLNPADILQLAAAIQSQRLNYGGAGGTANALTVALTPVLLAYTAGLPVRVRATADNTGAATLNINGLGAKAVVTPTNTALLAGDIKNGMILNLFFDPVLDKFVFPAAASAVRQVTPSYMTFSSGSITLSDSVLTNINLAAAVQKFSGGTTISTTSMTIGTADAGLWQLGVSAFINDASAGGSVASFVRRNGSDIASATTLRDSASAMNKAANASVVYPLAAGDVITFVVGQSNMGATRTMQRVDASAARLGNS